MNPTPWSSLLDRARASGPDTHTSIEPATGRDLVTLTLSSPQDVSKAFADARAAQSEWAKVSVRERAGIMLAFHDLVLSRRDEGLDIIQRETGKARRDALEEILDIAITTRHYARDATRLLAPIRHRGALPALVGVQELHHPKGVVGIVSPWNYPMTLAASDAVPALLAGNAVVIKPDWQTSLCALWVASLLSEAGLPDGLFNVVLGDGPVVGPQVVAQADYVMFTGSTAVGRQIAAQCGERLIGCSLELGGKNPMIIRADADLDKAVEVAARACFANSGQLCISIERIYIHDSVAAQFVGEFANAVAALTLSPQLGWGASMGSLISQRQLDRVDAQVQDAVTKGAQVVVGGRPRPDLGPFMYEPTVLTHVTSDMELCAAETFGPVVSVYTFESDDEAIELANSTEYGLNASIITRDLSAGRAMAARIEAGTVNVNEGYAAAWGSTRSPMGGMKASGLGRRHGVDGLLKYTEPQTVATQRLLGFGAPSGMSDERWGSVLTTSIRWMKRLGFR